MRTIQLPDDLQDQLAAFCAAADDRVQGFKIGMEHAKQMMAQQLVAIARQRAQAQPQPKSE
jgi:hypothetical protein